MEDDDDAVRELIRQRFSALGGNRLSGAPAVLLPTNQTVLYNITRGRSIAARAVQQHEARQHQAAYELYKEVCCTLHLAPAPLSLSITLCLCARR